MSSEMDRLIEAERERCARLVEHYRGQFTGYSASLVNRLSNIIRNGTVPESFVDQMASKDETEYSEPSTVEEERLRCLNCLLIHYDDELPIEVREMLLDLESAFQSGE